MYQIKKYQNKNRNIENSLLFNNCIINHLNE